MSKSKDPWRQESYHSIEESDSDSPVEKKRRVSSGDGPHVTASEEDNTASVSTKEDETEKDSLEEITKADQEKEERDDFSDITSETQVEGYENGNASAPSESFDMVDDPLFWGPYLSERQWGTVREDYSEQDNSWEHISHEDAVSHAYVSGEDGLLGVCDRFSLLCASVALWNGKDCMLKERLFGLTGVEGNHGEDVKELYYYLDNTPDHSYMRALYKYPQSAFPYQMLREENKRRSLLDPEFELLDTGIFDMFGHWDVMVEYAKTDHLGIACRIMAINNSQHEEQIHIIPQFLLRNVRRGREPIPQMSGHLQPVMSANSDGSVQIHYQLGHWRLEFMSADCEDGATLLFTDNTSVGCKSCHDKPLYTKDAFHKYIVQGKHEAVNPGHIGTKCAGLHRLIANPGGHVSVYWRIEPAHAPMEYTISDYRELFTRKRNEAQKFYDSVFSGSLIAEERNVAVQAIAGLLWSKQYYCFDVKTWLKDYRKCRQNRGRKARNYGWGHVLNYDILLMPDKWEFPWYAGWDLCISTVLLARYDVQFAKEQMLIFLSDNYMNARGQLPGCEFEMGQSNPPLQPWACLHVYQMDQNRDFNFLRRCYHRLLLNYGWWCSLEYEETRTYGRGFLGMDNISVVDRSGPLPSGWTLVQADCTAWVACFCLWMLRITLELGTFDPAYLDMAPKFLNHFLQIAEAINHPIADMGLWHEEDRFFYDVFHTLADVLPIRVRSWTGMIPLFAVASITLPNSLAVEEAIVRMGENEIFLSLLPMERVRYVLQKVFSTEEFYSPFGIRSLSKAHQGIGVKMQVGPTSTSAHYAPGESDCGFFGGNSNWRGPVWMFMNYLLLESLDVYQHKISHSGSDISLPRPYSSPDCTASLAEMMVDLTYRLVSIFLPNSHGDRPVHGVGSKYAVDPKWRHLVLFYEFFHADTGRGCGASHQTGWTATVIELLLRLQKSRVSSPRHSSVADHPRPH
ncbi:hypothetical protein BaRGS_00002814 [Batillaria attramentaria]|uniref:Glycosyl hydrolase family 63 C-terminal domain-containing protein n=1 Tax=Batillaria attramentaria TaxID=370345 RepID=A0ABD0M395_9CAEN